jgi:hypothetical protein
MLGRPAVAQPSHHGEATGRRPVRATTTAKPPAARPVRQGLPARVDSEVVPAREPGPPPRRLPVPDHLFVTSKDDLAVALEEADRRLDPPVPVRVRWGGEWHLPALLHGWLQSDDRGDGWLGCVEYHREIAPGFGYAVGRWTPAWNIERAGDVAPPL